ncbi:MAG: hypothetical protein NTZ05_06625 [Chloroflexi bacterium]|nr:hypothetical protein [Chloroflexota bacterium]
MIPEFRAALADHLQRLFAQRQQAGLLREFDARIVAEGMLGFVERVAAVWCVGGRQPAMAPEKLAAEVVGFMTRGVARLPVETAGPPMAGNGRQADG